MLTFVVMFVVLRLFRFVVSVALLCIGTIISTVAAAIIVAWVTIAMMLVMMLIAIHFIKRWGITAT